MKQSCDTYCTHRALHETLIRSGQNATKPTISIPLYYIIPSFLFCIPSSSDQPVLVSGQVHCSRESVLTKCFDIIDPRSSNPVQLNNLRTHTHSRWIESSEGIRRVSSQSGTTDMHLQSSSSVRLPLPSPRS